LFLQTILHPILKPFLKTPFSAEPVCDSQSCTQYAALCYRVVKGETEVLLVTSRSRGNWIMPKGWPMEGKTPAECAAIEAWEEAGVTGKISERCLGLYTYEKSLEKDTTVPCIGMVFPLRVTKTASSFPEIKQRRRKWVTLEKAAKMLFEPELAQIVKSLDPAKLDN